MDAWATGAAFVPYCGPGATPADLLGRWNGDPLLLTALAVAAILLWRAKARWAAWAALGLAALLFVSPLCALSSALFSVRTVHHVLLAAVLAPLAAWSLPPARRGGLALATLAAAGVFWSWHAPAAYAFALSHDGAYWLMQGSLFVTALAFWMAVRAARPLPAIAALLVSTVQMGLLGAVLTLAGRALYAPHFATTLAWGQTPLADQQAAGLIMWAPAAAIYLAVALRRMSRQLQPDGMPA
ncbi:cytochrome c oxidase assembly protein [Phenylobacterium sp.]|jgi:putative membrane protein|uniref:cytochrome c oxidase assembly protein n=1 Tax=Phenylobacterium sp. TaxID=1871053 RepID=UPI0037847E1A